MNSPERSQPNGRGSEVKLTDSSAAGSVQAETSPSHAGYSVLSAPDGNRLSPIKHAAGQAFRDRLDALATASYATATLGALHQAVRALEYCRGGPRLDRLATSLQRLFQHCNDMALQWARIKVEADVHPVTRVHVQAEKEHAKKIAEAVSKVCSLVRARALGELDQSELNAAWLRTWDSVALPSRQSKSD